MAKHLLIVLSNPVKPELEGEYNDWYSNKHLQDLVKLPGVLSARRYKKTAQLATVPTAPYLAIYEIETDDAVKHAELIASVSNTERMPLSPGLDVPNVYAAYYLPITDAVLRKD